ncbi:Tim17/Tim22/Tim23/Pmp24 family-domain-containing protein [Entophlyctis helioformis]|nr:Tim17/Tim22/Tim23/Pmp24 family-domain-containing protein [Entophlyctis helioformis]
MDALNQLLASGQHKDLLAIVKGFRNGAVYGAKIRFPHALVMTFLFRRTDLKSMAKSILKLTYQHSRNLAVFVTIYKSLLLIQRKIKGFEHNADSFIAGIIGGYIVFGKNTAVNNQIVLYLFSRVAMGVARLAIKRKVIPKPKNSFPVFAAVTWGIVMWLFRHDRDTLQPSLQSSMQYLYNDSDHFDNFKNWLWHNK